MSPSYYCSLEGNSCLSKSMIFRPFVLEGRYRSYRLVTYDLFIRVEEKFIERAEEFAPDIIKLFVETRHRSPVDAIPI